MNTALVDGLQIVLVVSVTSVVLIPLLCWVLPDRIQPTNGTRVA
ncbi:hypothetical protein [Almyronema epifaneia]|uniref:Uncharacterized protein n=1 Tax=Almyronema epifaneia S1 TaxID=2991925 RepID=A0ABW6IC77_9CYAN